MNKHVLLEVTGFVKMLLCSIKQITQRGGNETQKRQAKVTDPRAAQPICSPVVGLNEGLRGLMHYGPASGQTAFPRMRHKVK